MEKSEMISAQGKTEESARPNSKSAPARKKRRLRIAGICLLLLAALLVAGRLYLPYIVKDYVNRTLDRMSDYRGSVDDIDIALFRGAYRINGLKILKRSGKINEPFIYAPGSDLSIQWRALLHGRLVGEIEMENPKMNIVNGDSNDTHQVAMKKGWTDVVKDLFPFKINRFAISNGTISYRHEGPKDDEALTLSALNAEISNLNNATRDTGELPSSISATALLQKVASVELHSRFNPFVQPPLFSADLSMKEIALTQLNTLLRKTIGADAESGTLSVYAEADSDNKGFHGYVKPIAKNVSLLSLQKDAKHPLHLIWEGLVALVVEIFTNQRHDQFASKIPFEGKYDDPQADVFSAIVAVIKNAFFEAIPAGIERSTLHRDIVGN